MPVRIVILLLLGAGLLSGAARLRGAEYDEFYSLFVTSGTPRPDWPGGTFRAGQIRLILANSASPARIATELRRTDVHPPLYFWALATWCGLAGHGLRAARLLSVLAALAALGLVGAVAAASGVPAAPAMAFTLGSYAFVYTGAIARDFALAEALALGGTWLALRAAAAPRAPPRRFAAAGLLLGAASFTNYLATFIGAAVLAGLALPALRPGRIGDRRRDAVTAGACLAGMAVWLPAGLWFFVAQRDSRVGQFTPFRLGGSLLLLARDAGGAVFGGLPLYVSGTARLAVGAALALLLAGLTGLIAARWRRIGRGRARLVLGLGAVAPAVGLLGLGLVFDSTPIELRYLAFATPFFGLLLAGALATLKPRPAGTIGALVLGVQALALAGLLTRPETMQPGRAAAAAAARLAGPRGVVLLARGNDGVGVVGPFLLEAPPWLRVRLVTPAMSPAALRQAAAGASRVVLALVGVDRDSRATVLHLRAAFAGGSWRVLGRGFDALALTPATPAPPGARVSRSHRGTSPRAG